VPDYTLYVLNVGTILVSTYYFRIWVYI